MKKKTKLILIIAGAAAAVILALLLILKPFEKKTVDVYPVSALASMDYSAMSSELSGTVREEGFQNVFLTDTQTVKQLFVHTGQEVAAGDPLLAYDTTLSEIQLEKASLDVQKLKLELQKSEQELAKINALVPSSEILVRPDNSWLTYHSVDTPFLLSGAGTRSDPLYYIIDATDDFNADFFRSVLPDGSGTVYVVLLIRENNALNGRIEQSFGFEIHIAGEDFSFKPFIPNIPDSIADYDEPEENYYEKRGSEYTSGEIAAMRTETEGKIRELSMQVRVAELEYEKKTKEASDNTVYAKQAGTVTFVGNPDTAYKSGDPVIRISSGGGFFVDIMIGELSLNKVNPGDTVMVSALESGKVCEGTITKISDVPAQNGMYYYEGNTNTSYYAATVSVSGEEDLKEGDYVSVSVSGEPAAMDTFILENMFLIQEKGHTYVYADKNGKLEKREIKTGQNMYGYSTQIKEGLTLDDMIAFPYGKQVKEGAPTKAADVSELYR